MEICWADLSTVWGQNYTSTAVYLLFRSTNGNSCCRGNTSSPCLWGCEGRRIPRNDTRLYFGLWCVGWAAESRELPVTMGGRFTGHIGLRRKPISCQAVYLIVSIRACGRWEQGYMVISTLNLENKTYLYKKMLFLWWLDLMWTTAYVLKVHQPKGRFSKTAN